MRRSALQENTALDQATQAHAQYLSISANDVIDPTRRGGRQSPDYYADTPLALRAEGRHLCGMYRARSLHGCRSGRALRSAAIASDGTRRRSITWSTLTYTQARPSASATRRGDVNVPLYDSCVGDFGTVNTVCG